MMTNASAVPVPHACPLCEAMCGVTVSRNGDVFSVRPNPDDPWSHGHICPKGTTLGALHTDPDRLRTPMIRHGSNWVAASWEDAFARIRVLAQGVRDTYGPDAFAAYGGNMAGKNFTLARYMPQVFRLSGIRQIFSSSTVDQHPKNVSTYLMFGSMWKIPIPDLDHTELFVIMGGNPAASKGSIFSYPDVMGGIRKLQARGGRAIVIDPVRTGTAEKADQWIGLRPGTDAALLLAVAHVLFDENRIRLGHLADRINGLEAVQTLSQRFAPERVAPFCGIEAATIRELAREIARTDRVALYGRIGLCTQEFGTLACWMVDVLAVLTGNLDRIGGTMWSRPVAPEVEMMAEMPPGLPVVMGHSRVRGAPQILGQAPASCMAEEIDTPGEGQIKGLLTFAANPVLSAPGSARLDAALPLLECMVSLDNYINETTRHAHVILPSVSFLEQPHYDMWSWVFCLTSGGSYWPPLLPHPDRPEEWEVLARTAAILGGQPDDDPKGLDDAYFAFLCASRGIDADHALALSPVHGPERVVDLAIRTGPFGDRFGQVPDGICLDTFRRNPGGLLIGHATERAAEGFATPSGRIELAPEHILGDVPRLEEMIDAPHPEFVLVSRRHLRSLNSWMHNVEALAKGKDRCTLLVHEADAARLGIVAGELVELASVEGAIEVPVELTVNIRPGVVSMPHGWGHAGQEHLSVAARHPGRNSNIVSPGRLVDKASSNAVLNGIPVRIRKTSAGAPVRAGTVPAEAAAHVEATALIG